MHGKIRRTRNHLACMRGNVYISVEAEGIVERILAGVHAIEFFSTFTSEYMLKNENGKTVFFFSFIVEREVDR